jgi:hypothetical protein
MIQLNQGSSCLYHLNQWNKFLGDSENSIRLLEIFLDPFGAGDCKIHQKVTFRAVTFQVWMEQEQYRLGQREHYIREMRELREELLNLKHCP